MGWLGDAREGLLCEGSVMGARRSSGEAWVAGLLITS